MYAALFNIIMMCSMFYYHKCGKIHWAKLSWIQSNEVFTGKRLQCLTFKILKITPLYKAHIRM